MSSWLCPEQKFLILFSHMPRPWIAEQLGKSKFSVRHRVSQLGIGRQRKKWQDWEDVIVLEQAGKMPWKRIGQLLGTSGGSARKRYERLMEERNGDR